MSLHADEVGLLECLTGLEQVAQVSKYAKGAMWQVSIFWRGASVSQAQERIANAYARHSVELPVDLVSRPPTLEEVCVTLAGELKR